MFIIGMVFMVRKRQSVTTVTSGVDADGRRETSATPLQHRTTPLLTEFGDSPAVVVAHGPVALVRAHAQIGFAGIRCASKTPQDVGASGDRLSRNGTGLVPAGVELLEFGERAAARRRAGSCGR